MTPYFILNVILRKTTRTCVVSSILKCSKLLELQFGRYRRYSKRCSGTKSHEIAPIGGAITITLHWVSATVNHTSCNGSLCFSSGQKLCHASTDVQRMMFNVFFSTVVNQTSTNTVNNWNKEILKFTTRSLLNSFLFYTCSPSAWLISEHDIHTDMKTWAFI